MAVCLRNVGSLNLRGAVRSVANDGWNDERSRADQRGKMMVVRERALMVRKAAIRMGFALVGSGNLHRSELGLRIQMKRREQLKADIPDKYEQNPDGTLPPEKRHGLREGSPVPSDLISHASYLSSKIIIVRCRGHRRVA